MSKFESPQFLIEKYKKAYNQNPGSKFFAPLAEAHRKAGNYDEAIDLLKRGIKDHPHYASAYVCLAECYLDLNQLNVAYSLLSPLVADHAENYKLMSIYALVAEKLSYLDKALETYKTILFLQPKDSLAINKVKVLEGALREPVISSENEASNFFDISQLEDTSWREVNLSNIEEMHANKEEAAKEKVISKSKPEVKINFEEDISQVQEEKFETQPVITHTLVDLYLNQGHREKALEIVEKILQTNPSDQRTIEKREQILRLMREKVSDQEKQENVTLMNLYDQKIGNIENLNDKQGKLENFLVKIKARAQEKQDQYEK